LTQWWSAAGDPLLAELIDAAVQAGPTLSAATARVEQARAARVAAAASLGPQVQGVGAAGRAVAAPDAPAISSASVGLAAAWEIDLFGGDRAQRDAAQARLEAARADWYAARVAVTAETATTYTALRACEAQWQQLVVDADSRAETARLSDVAAAAGVLAPSSAALARASTAQARAQVTTLRARCDGLVKALAALTAIDEPALATRLAPGTARVVSPAEAVPRLLPAALLERRPDLVAASYAVAAAAADQRAAEADRLPRVSFAGAVGPMSVSAGSGRTEGATWSLGPLRVTMPLYDGGTRVARAEAARVAYDDAVFQLQAWVRQAVREVEDTLLVLQATAARADDVRRAADDYEAAFRAAEARYRGGLGSVFELEDARRTAVLARVAVVELQRERATAWIGLYRALGGGFDRADLTAAR
jgi:NodT family efflux transporter outer membrane factor (OMF) lipoprotein